MLTRIVESSNECTFPISERVMATTDAGLYQRHYDTVTEETDLDSANEIATVLGWMGGPGGAKASKNTLVDVAVDAAKSTAKIIADNTVLKKSRDKQRLDRILAAGLALQEEDNIAALNGLRAAAFNVPLVVRAGEAISNIAEPLLNIISDKRTKSLLFSVGAIVVGGGAGFLIGSFVLPGLGSAIGGGIGALLASSGVALGGGIGLAVIGAGLGEFFGPKLADIFFKDERGDLTKKQKRSLIKMGISQHTADQMNEYIKNRENNVSSALCKRVYQTLRKVGIKEADPEGMDQVARFFCHELVLLEKEIEGNKQNEALMHEIEAVREILNNLANLQKLSDETRSRIQNTLSEYEAHQKSAEPSVNMADELHTQPVMGEPPRINAPAQNLQPARQKTMQFSATPESKRPRDIALLTPEQLEKVEKRFKKTLEPDYIIKKIKSDPQAQNPNSVDCRYRVKTLDNTRLAEIDFHEEMASEDHLKAHVLVDRRMNGKINELAHIMAVHTKAYLHKAPHADITVVAAKDDSLAIELMAAALTEGLNPHLDPEEYPDHTLEDRAKIEKIIQEAYQLANLSPPYKKPKIGFKMDTPKPT